MIENTREVLAMLTNYGIIFFTTIDFKIIDFFPLIGTSVKDSKSENSSYFGLIFSDQSEKILNFASVNMKNQWLDKINDTISSFEVLTKSTI